MPHISNDIPFKADRRISQNYSIVSQYELRCKEVSIRHV